MLELVLLVVVVMSLHIVLPLELEQLKLWMLVLKVLRLHRSEPMLLPVALRYEVALYIELISKARIG